MRWGWAILGIVMIMIGEVWLLQGLGRLPGSFMTGSPFWAGAGTVVVLAGIACVLRSARR
jgi:hypothetical protein